MGDNWEKDEDAPVCRQCSAKFGWFLRRHHCRYCRRIFCHRCSSRTITAEYLPGIKSDVRVCDTCYQKLAHRQAKVSGSTFGSARPSTASTSLRPSVPTEETSSPPPSLQQRSLSPPSVPSHVDPLAPVETGPMSLPQSLVSDSPTPFSALFSNQLPAAVRLDEDSDSSSEGGLLPLHPQQSTQEWKSKTAAHHPDSRSNSSQSSFNAAPAPVQQVERFVDIVFHQVARVDRNTKVDFCPEAFDVELRQKSVKSVGAFFPLPAAQGNTINQLLEPRTLTNSSTDVTTDHPSLERALEAIGKASSTVTLRQLHEKRSQAREGQVIYEESIRAHA